MSNLEPLINLVVLMSTLSIAAERLTNAIKLRRADPDVLPIRLRGRHGSRDSRRMHPGEEKEWERLVGHQALLVSILLAVLLKADFFEIVGNLNAPWDTLGWVRLSGSQMVRNPALDSLPRALYTLSGAILTGIAMGFGSKFWHDVLDIVYSTRGRIKQVSGSRGQVSGDSQS
jgi:hypothetical protein